MANVATLLQTPELKSTKFTGLPLGKTDRETGNRFLGKLVQYLLVNPYSGLMSALPDSVSYFMRQTPQHPAFGEKYARVTMTTTLSWPMPKIDVGEQYKHIKPPMLAILEEGMKREFKFQSSVALATHEWMSHYINAEVHGKLVSYVAANAKSSINRTITQLFNVFWLSVGGNKYVFGDPSLEMFYMAATEADVNKSQGLLKKYQEDMEPYVKQMMEDAALCKNIIYADPRLYASWTNKGDNKITVRECKPPSGVNDLKTFFQKHYAEGAQQKDINGARTHSLLMILNLIRRKISDLTYEVPSYKNNIKYDPNVAMTEQTQLEEVRCDLQDLVVVVSDWDYDELKRGVSTTGQTQNIGDNLDAATAGVGLVMKKKGLPPGFAFVGDNNFFNMIVVLDHNGSVFHFREEETQWYSNYYINTGVFTQQIAGCQIRPCGSFHPGGNFLNEYGYLLKE